MKPLPHHYRVTVSAHDQVPVEITSPGLVAMDSMTPAEFDGPGNLWSPETLLVAATADCFALTFRAMANASKLIWTEMDCSAMGTLDRASEGMRFTAIDMSVRLSIPPATDREKALKLIAKAEKNCLVANSLAFRPTVTAELVTAAP